MANAEFGPAGEYLTVLEAAAEGALWLYDKYPLIKAYLDAPKSLEELQNNVGKSRIGYDVYHIVEKTAAERDGHLRADFDAPDNLVRIPRLQHWETSSLRILCRLTPVLAGRALSRMSQPPKAARRDALRIAPVVIRSWTTPRICEHVLA